jgi:hypothetical protein
VTTATAPTVAVVSDTVQGDQATVKQITTPMTEKMTPKDQEIWKKHNICKLHAMYADCKFGTLCRSSYLSEAERKTKGLRFAAHTDSEHEIMMDFSMDDVISQTLNVSWLNPRFMVKPSTVRHV